MRAFQEGELQVNTEKGTTFEIVVNKSARFGFNRRDGRLRYFLVLSRPLHGAGTRADLSKQECLTKALEYYRMVGQPGGTPKVVQVDRQDYGYEFTLEPIVHGMQSTSTAFLGIDAVDGHLISFSSAPYLRYDRFVDKKLLSKEECTRSALGAYARFAPFRMITLASVRLYLGMPQRGPVVYEEFTRDERQLGIDYVALPFYRITLLLYFKGEPIAPVNIDVNALTGHAMSILGYQSDGKVRAADFVGPKLEDLGEFQCVGSEEKGTLKRAEEIRQDDPDGPVVVLRHGNTLVSGRYDSAKRCLWFHGMEGWERYEPTVPLLKGIEAWAAVKHERFGSEVARIRMLARSAIKMARFAGAR